MSVRRGPDMTSAFDGIASRPGAADFIDSLCGETQPAADSETHRLLRRMCYTAGTRFRREVIRRGRERYEACPLDIGVDYNTLLTHCHYRERIEYRYRLFMLLILII